MTQQQITDMIRAHNQALSDKNLQLLALANHLCELIDQLALTPADDFYKPGDHAAGLVNDAWIKKNELMSQAGLSPLK